MFCGECIQVQTAKQAPFRRLDIPTAEEKNGKGVEIFYTIPVAMLEVA